RGAAVGVGADRGGGGPEGGGVRPQFTAGVAAADGRQQRERVPEGVPHLRVVTAHGDARRPVADLVGEVDQGRLVVGVVLLAVAEGALHAGLQVPAVGLVAGCRAPDELSGAVL